MSDYQTFVVPYDFSAHATAALYVATDLARRLNADVHLIHVLQLPSYPYGVGTYGTAAAPPVDLSHLHDSTMQSLREVVDEIDVSGKLEPHVLEGAGIANMICESARELDADLIVMGTHGRSGLAHVVLGSVAERTLRCAPCPVLTVRAPARARRVVGHAV